MARNGGAAMTAPTGGATRRAAAVTAASDPRAGPTAATDAATAAGHGRTRTVAPAWRTATRVRAATAQSTVATRPVDRRTTAVAAIVPAVAVVAAGRPRRTRSSAPLAARSSTRPRRRARRAATSATRRRLLPRRRTVRARKNRRAIRPFGSGLEKGAAGSPRAMLPFEHRRVRRARVLVERRRRGPRPEPGFRRRSIAWTPLRRRWTTGGGSRSWASRSESTRSSVSSLASVT